MKFFRKNYAEKFWILFVLYIDVLPLCMSTYILNSIKVFISGRFDTRKKYKMADNVYYENAIAKLINLN